MTTTQTDLGARLAAVLEPLLPRCIHGDEYIDDDCRQYRLGQAAEWAARCLTDANAALELVTEHGPGPVTMQWWPHEVGPRGYDVAIEYGADDEVPHLAESGVCETFHEALMAAFCDWAESEAGT